MRAKTENAIVLLLAAYPLVWLVLFYVYMLCVRARIGHFPVPMIDTSGFRPDRYPDAPATVLSLSLLVVPLAALIAPLWLPIRRHALWPRVFRWSLALFGLSVIAFLSLWNIDPGHCIEWFLD
jgi:hypothetical protein